MFDSIKQFWNESRGNLINKELSDILDKLSRLNSEVEILAYVSFADNYINILNQYGSLENISNKEIKGIAANCIIESKKHFDYNMGASYGLYLLGLHFESKIFSGAEAQYVHLITSDMLKTALATRDGLKDCGVVSSIISPKY